MPTAEAVVLRCRPVRETRIYDQLRDEGINAEVVPRRIMIADERRLASIFRAARIVIFVRSL